MKSIVSLISRNAPILFIVAALIGYAVLRYPELPPQAAHGDGLEPLLVHQAESGVDDPLARERLPGPHRVRLQSHASSHPRVTGLTGLRCTPRLRTS